MNSGNQIYIKHFSNPEQFASELKVYQLGLPMIPKLLGFQEPDTLSIQRIAGLPYLDADAGFNPQLLGQTIAQFHRATLTGDKCLCHIDNQPKNILWDGESYFLIDFCDSHFAYPECDISHLLLFWAEDFPHSVFAPASIKFLKAYNRIIPIHPKRWESCVVESISRFDARRRLYGKGNGMDDLFMKIANRVWLLSYFRK